MSYNVYVIFFDSAWFANNLKICLGRRSDLKHILDFVVLAHAPRAFWARLRGG